MELVEERPLALGVAHDRLEPADETGPRVLVGDGVFGGPHQLIDVGAVDGLDDVDPLRKVAVQGAHPDPRLFGDGLHGRAAAVLGKHLPGGHDQPIVVAAGIRTPGSSRAATTSRSLLRRASERMARPVSPTSSGPPPLSSRAATPILRWAVMASA